MWLLLRKCFAYLLLLTFLASVLIVLVDRRPPSEPY